MLNAYPNDATCNCLIRSIEFLTKTLIFFNFLSADNNINRISTKITMQLDDKTLTAATLSW